MKITVVEKLLPKRLSRASLKRSLLKTIIYRVLIVALDFGFIYLFTGKLKVAVGFMIVSNIYTSVSYFFYERIWDKIKWGTEMVDSKEL